MFVELQISYGFITSLRVY